VALGDAFYPGLSERIKDMIASVRTGRNKKGIKAPLTADKKECRRGDKLCGYCASGDCHGGVSQDPALCPLVIAKEDAKRQRREGNGNRLALMVSDARQ
jgi:hypothetical protein